MARRPLISTEKPSRADRPLPAALGCLPALALLGAYLLVRGSPSAAQRITDGFAFPVRQVLAGLCSHVPVSVMEILYVLFGAWVLAFVIRSIVLLCRRHRKGRVLLRRVLILVMVGLYLGAIDCWLWGIGTYSESFTEKAGFTGEAADEADLITTAEYFLAKANELAPQMRRSDTMAYEGDTDALFRESVSAYAGVEKEFPCLDCVYYAPKPMVFSRLMSYTGFTGVYFTYTGESNINVDAPAALTALVIAHEMAHQGGVYAEQEANFVAVAACAASGVPEYEYAGYLGGLIYTMNALHRTNAEAWQKLRGQLSPQVEKDWQDDIDYWNGMRTPLETAYKNAYDKYLKFNGQTLGMQSYGACVNLLVEYFLPIAQGSK